MSILSYLWKKHTRIFGERQPAGILKRSGSYVHNLNFLVDDIEETVAKYKKEKIKTIFKLKLTPDAETHYYMMRSLRKVGFHMEHGETPDIALPPGFFFTEYKKESKK